MTVPDLTEVINTWCTELEELGQKYAWSGFYETPFWPKKPSDKYL
jgi:hypothetical protein